MLRVGLTGDLGSGKSTVARMLAERGAVVLSSDEIGRRLMQPGEAVYASIVERFGREVVAEDGSLDRRKLAALAFDRLHPRAEELNEIVHPAVLRVQAEELTALETREPRAIAVVETALLFTTQYGTTNWRGRFDRILLVTAPEEQKIARFIDRAAAGRELSMAEHDALEADARRRLALQQNDSYASECLVLHNDGDIEQLEQQVDAVWKQLRAL